MKASKLAVTFSALALLVAPALARSSGGHSSSKSSGSKVQVKGYTKKDGTKVEPHDRTTPNKTEKDNWSTKGNTNPETGKDGTKEPAK